MMKVLLLPTRHSFRTWVSLLLRNTTLGFYLAKSPIIFENSNKLLFMLPKNIKNRWERGLGIIKEIDKLESMFNEKISLILPASLSLYPSDRVFFCRSLPAISTKLSLLINSLWLSALVIDIWTLKMEWDLGFIKNEKTFLN